MVNCFPNMHKSLGSIPSTARSKLMTVQNVKIRSLGNSELTESTVKCFNSIRPPTKTFSDVRVASSPIFRKKR